MRFYRTTIAGLGLALALAACAPAPYESRPAAYAPGPILPAEAQRVIDLATATAQAESTRVARVTEAAQAARLAVDLESTQAENTIRLTRAALENEAARAALAATIEAGRIAASGDFQNMAATATAQARADQFAGAAAAVGISLITFGGMALTVALAWAILRAGVALESYYQARAEGEHARAAQLAIVILGPGAAYDARAGRLIEAPRRATIAAGQPPADRAGYRVIPGSAGGQPRDLDMTAGLSESERLLIRAIEVAGAGSETIPPAYDLGYSGARRAAALRDLGDRIETRRGGPGQGGGTFVKGFRNVAELLQAIREESEDDRL